MKPGQDKVERYVASVTKTDEPMGFNAPLGLKAAVAGVLVLLLAGLLAYFLG